MIDSYDAETLAMHNENIREKALALAQATRKRDDHIRAMLKKGAKPTELGKVIGLSRERIYQIEKGK